MDETLDRQNPGRHKDEGAKQESGADSKSIYLVGDYNEWHEKGYRKPAKNRKA
jgi:hypothetical protein